MKTTQVVKFMLQTVAPMVVTLLLSYWAYATKMAELDLERLKIEKELNRRVDQVEAMRSQLYE